MSLQDEITLENISSYGNALIAHANAKRHKKRYSAIQQFEENLPDNLHQLCDEFANGTYRTTSYTIKHIFDSGKLREIAKVPYRDRVAQWMIANYYAPYLRTIFYENSHAAIPGKGDHTALAQTEYFVREKKYKYCLKIDAEKYFASVNRSVLKAQIEEDIPDKRVVEIIWNIINDQPGNVGIVIGNYFSQIVANRYMTPLDRWLGARVDFVRYMDDLVIFGNSREELMKLYREMEWFIQRELYLNVKGNWQIFEIADRGIDFVGYRIWQERTILRKRTFANLRRKCSKILKHLREGRAFTDKMRSVVMSYLGWVKFCTERDRKFIFRKYFSEILSIVHIKLKPKMWEAFYGNS